ncbi:MAG: hypothetical protein GY943_32840 [Chloroflexi bacterium]|nr:hypothetical protein [Chloroflexota bacterium]
MSKEIATAVITILDHYAKDNGQALAAADGEAAKNLAHAMYVYVLELFREDDQLRWIAERYRQYPKDYSTPLRIELIELMAKNSPLTTKLKNLVQRYGETAVSPPPNTQINVTGSGTVVQGDNNVVVGAGATYINQNESGDDEQVAASSAQTPSSFISNPEQFRVQIADLFNFDELESLCWDLVLPYDDFGGVGHQGKVRELIAYCGRNGRLPDLLTYCRQKRGHVSWDYEIDL